MRCLSSLIYISPLVVVEAFVATPSSSQNLARLQAAEISNTNTVNDLASFAASLDDNDQESLPSNNNNKNRQTTTTSAAANEKRDWKVILEDFLDPSTPVTQRQALFSDLVSSNQDIRSSVESAIRDRSIDPLLTPRGKRLREGSRAVARQLTSDILPELLPPPTTASSPKKPLSAQGGSSFLPPPPPLPPLDPQDLEKVGNRVFNALQNRLQDGFKTMQSDMQNEPWKRIPERLTQQSRDLLKEANNIFAETPEGLQEPPYTVVQQGPDYEIRQYEAYQVASTTMGSGSIGNDKDKEDAEPLPSNQDSTSDPYSPAQNGAAFNTLAAYLFGANKEGVSMEMTTPVTTTMSGEMRFYLGPRYDGSSTSTTPLSPPEPLAQDESSTNEYWYGLDKPGQILIQDIPPARLAVRRFTGFATKGEVMRQKNALLAGLALDGVELDVPHGSTVPHVVFQYNPPYTLPVLRRNEIAVAVLPFMEEEAEAEAKSVQP